MSEAPEVQADTPATQPNSEADFSARPEVAEEFEKSLRDGIDDEAVLDESAGAPQFSITSYGADYTVDSLVKRMKTGAFIIPQFQRKFVWSQRHASKFIESLLMGLPVPGIFLYKQPDTKYAPCN